MVATRVTTAALARVVESLAAVVAGPGARGMVGAVADALEREVESAVLPAAVVEAAKARLLTRGASEHWGSRARVAAAPTRAGGGGLMGGRRLIRHRRQNERRAH